MTRLRRWAGAVVDWVGYRWCGLTTGHFYLVTRIEQMVRLECTWCGHRPRGGWNLRAEGGV